MCNLHVSHTEGNTLNIPKDQKTGNGKGIIKKIIIFDPACHLLPLIGVLCYIDNQMI